MHAWRYYFPELRDDELLLFKGFDSEPEATKYVLHSAMRLQGKAEVRESAEVRTIAFFKKACFGWLEGGGGSASLLCNWHAPCSILEVLEL